MFGLDKDLIEKIEKKSSIFSKIFKTSLKVKNENILILIYKYLNVKNTKLPKIRDI